MFRVPKSMFQQKRSKRYIIPALSFQRESTVNCVCLSMKTSLPLADKYLAAHIHEAPGWVVPCLEDGTPTMARLYVSIRLLPDTTRSMSKPSHEIEC